VFAFQERGYFKTRIDQIDMSSLDLNIIPSSISVAVKVNEGKQYKLNSIVFRGERMFLPDQLRQQFAMSDGEIFNPEEIRRGLENLRKLYVSQGYA
jgi:outer membrane protein assembly factor BamA